MRLAILIALTGLVPATAVADPAPRLDLSRCDLFDEVAAARAIAAELGQRPGIDAISVTIACPDPLSARVAVEPSPPGEPLTRDVDLFDLPADLRLRLVALAVAELVEVALTVVPAPPPDPVPLPVPLPVPHPSPPLTLSPSTRRLRGLAQDKPSRRVSARLGARVFLAQPAPMLDLAVGLSRGRLAADLFVATHRERDPLGALRGTVGGVGISASAACRDRAGTHLCIAARAAAGIASITADPAGEMIAADDRLAFYLETGPRLEARLERAAWSGSLTIDAGWSWGLVGLAADRDVVRLTGPVITASLGIGWGR